MKADGERDQFSQRRVRAARRVGPLMVGALMAALLGLRPVGALDADWNPNVNSNAKQTAGHPNLVDYDIVFPVLGRVFIGGVQNSRSDDFCVRTRPYTNNGCNVTDAHGGVDFGALDGGSPAIVAAKPGNVVAVGCESGSGAGGRGFYVIIQDSSQRYWEYYHMAPGSLTVSQNQAVAAGQRIGMLSSTNRCTGPNNYYGPHLHFQMNILSMGPTWAIDPWLSAREAYARPGLPSNWSVPIAQMANKFTEVVNFFGGTTNGTNWIGYPTGHGYSTFTNGNVQWAGSGYTHGAGYIQYLVNGSGSYDPAGWRRSGAITYVAGAASAQWVGLDQFKKWLESNGPYGWLGWPTSGWNGSKQTFNGGCIVTYQSGGQATLVATGFGAYGC
jgi:murein DD-endopeptidase MepM/ murein hydrolase activator NlpD